MKQSVTIAGVEFKNPLIAASGTFGFGREYAEFFDLSKLGGICTKGLTLQPREGNISPRIAETASGILNSVGLQNPGVEHFISEDLPFLDKFDTVKIANIAGNTELDYCTMAWKISQTSIDMIELNISCPNVKEGGMAFGIKPETVNRITREVKAHCRLPLLVKLSPNVSSITEVAIAATEGGADALSLINTISGMAIDYRTRKPILGVGSGGLSGRAIKPIALKMVADVRKCTKLPIIGMGGIYYGKDVLEFMIAGANAVEIGTATISEPTAMMRILAELTQLMNECNIDDINSIVGTLQY